MSFFETKKIPTTHVFQNHLDQLNELFSEYCLSRPTHEWGILSAKKRIPGLAQVEAYLEKHKPQKIHYYVTDENNSGKVDVIIEDGITINLRNGDYSLLGFFYSIDKTIGTLKIPFLLVFLRRWWLVNICAAFWVTPAIVLVILSQSAWAWGWLIFSPFLMTAIAYWVLESMGRDPERAEVILDTKISYEVYRGKLGSSFYAFLTSTKSVISILAALATIVSTIVLFIRQ